ncbi:hypothetical protein Tsubulata_037433, partial [Turnera subulata]
MAVYKWWMKLITSPSFISRNLDGSLASTNQKPLFMLRHHHQYLTIVNRYSLHFENEEFDKYKSFHSLFSTVSHHDFIGSCNGLVCLASRLSYGDDKINNFILWNPLIQKYYNAPIYKYKQYKQRIFRAAICVGGILHSIATRVGSSGVNVIVSYDLREEGFGEIMLPDCLVRVQYRHKYHDCISISTYKDSSIMVCGDLGTDQFPIIQVWVLKEYGVVVDSWKKLSIDNGRLRIGRALRISSNDKLLLFMSHMGLSVCQSKWWHVCGSQKSKKCRVP